MRLGTDGVTGEYRPRPAVSPTPRTLGAGLGAVETAEPQDRPEKLARIRTGELASVHSWELVTAVDGPGTRLTIFLSGCPLRCLYCHNPDTFEMRRGETVETENLVRRMLRYRRILERSGGGLTLSGGEPLMQSQVVARMLRAAKEAGIHTAIDTSGNLGYRCSDAMLSDLDLCLLDLKSGDEAKYREVTGAQLTPTLEFAERLANADVEVWARFVLVPGLTDDPENIARVADIAATIRTCTRVEVLPFHQMGQDKWAELGLDYQLAHTNPPTEAETEAARDIFRSRGLTVY